MLHVTHRSRVCRILLYSASPLFAPLLEQQISFASCAVRTLLASQNFIRSFVIEVSLLS
jgi:hypothetical protein